MPLESFYEGVAQLAFTLFGLWWVVLELALDDLVTDRRLRRTVLHVSLIFLVPGVLSVSSLLATDVLAVWRVVFVVGGTVGGLATARFALSSASAASPVSRVVWFGVVLVEALFVVVAVARPSVVLGGTTLAPLTLTGALVVGLLLLGVVAAWQVLQSHAEARAEALDG